MKVISMETFEEYLEAMGEPAHRDKMEAILDWIEKNYPELERRIAWNQPVFVDHGTFIIGFSYSKNHIAMAPEARAIKKYVYNIEETGLTYTENIIRIKWADNVPYNLIKLLIDYNIVDKQNYEKFWR